MTEFIFSRIKTKPGVSFLYFNSISAGKPFGLLKSEARGVLIRLRKVTRPFYAI